MDAAPDLQTRLAADSRLSRAPRLELRRLLGLAPVALLCACTTVVVPPAAPPDPVSVFLLDHGRHSSLVLPLPDGGAVRYSYGDWDWYALNRTGVGSGLRALLWPTPAALGRKLLKGPVTEEGIRRQLRVEVLESLEIRVPGAAARRLGEALGSRFAAALDTLHYSVDYDVEFVRDPDPYTLGHNSNLVVARWLEALGCEIRGRPVLSDWRLETPPLPAGAARPEDPQPTAEGTARTPTGA